MDSPPASSCIGPCSDGLADGIAARKGEETLPPVDPFLVEALENPRHRLTVLRMELDIQRFLQSPEQCQFEFHHFPSSYLRRAAHRVAQHYGLQTVVLDGAADGKTRIMAVKKADSQSPPPIPLSDIPAKQPESLKPGESVKIVIRARPAGALAGGAAGTELWQKNSLSKTVEEREEEYGKARARIFNDNSGMEEREAAAAVAATVMMTMPMAAAAAGEGGEAIHRGVDEGEKNRIAAIFRDREKDRVDPDYDRSYGRYVRGALTSQNFNVGMYHGLQPCHQSQYELGFPQLRQMQGSAAGSRYQPAGHVVGSHFYAAGCNQPSGDGFYVPPCPSPTMMYAHTYEHFRDAVFQGPICQQPLSFEQHQYR